MPAGQSLRPQAKHNKTPTPYGPSYEKVAFSIFDSPEGRESVPETQYL
jgi:hypothetical protein